MPVGCSSRISRHSPSVHGTNSLFLKAQTSIRASSAGLLAVISRSDATQVLVIFIATLFSGSEPVASRWRVTAVPGQPANPLTCTNQCTSNSLTTSYKGRPCGRWGIICTNPCNRKLHSSGTGAVTTLCSLWWLHDIIEIASPCISVQGSAIVLTDVPELAEKAH